MDAIRTWDYELHNELTMQERRLEEIRRGDLCPVDRLNAEAENLDLRHRAIGYAVNTPRMLYGPPVPAAAYTLLSSGDALLRKMNSARSQTAMPNFLVIDVTNRGPAPSMVSYQPLVPIKLKLQGPNEVSLLIYDRTSWQRGPVQISIEPLDPALPPPRIGRSLIFSQNAPPPIFLGVPPASLQQIQVPTETLPTVALSSSWAARAVLNRAMQSVGRCENAKLWAGIAIAPGSTWTSTVPAPTQIVNHAQRCEVMLRSGMVSSQQASLQACRDYAETFARNTLRPGEMFQYVGTYNIRYGGLSVSNFEMLACSANNSAGAVLLQYGQLAAPDTSTCLRIGFGSAAPPERASIRLGTKILQASNHCLFVDDKFGTIRQSTTATEMDCQRAVDSYMSTIPEGSTTRPLPPYAVYYGFRRIR